MANIPNNREIDGASAQGASLSEPASAKPAAAKRPSMAGAKRVQHAKVAAVKQSKHQAAAALADAALVKPDKAPANVEAAGFDGASDQVDAMPAKGTSRPSVEDYARDSAADVRARAKTNRTEAPDGEDAEPRKKKKKQGLGAGVVALIVVACLLVAGVAAASVTRWVLPDDATDLQGTWHVQDSQGDIVISDSEIDLAGQASYQYSMDAFAKTIDATFFTMEGTAHYRFSRDRQSVAVIECSDYGWLALWQLDLKWAWEDFVALVGGNSYDPLGQDSGITLVRQ